MSNPLVEIQDLTIKYSTKSEDITAVSDASITLEEGELFGLVGESGCGKTTLAKSIIGGLDSNGRVVKGKIKFKGQEIQDYSERKLNERIRWTEISYVPQASMDSLDPLKTIREQAFSIAKSHSDLSRKEVTSKLSELFSILGLPKDRINEYPHEFSGGMRQRAIIALSLILDPSMIIADEPTTAIDVIMQDALFKYFENVQEDICILLITHDISLVFESCRRMAVMHAGQIMERGLVVDIYDSPKHPYTILLQESFPDIRFPDEDLIGIEGDPPQTVGDVAFCTFRDRCPWADGECDQSAPNLVSAEDSSQTDSHVAACFKLDQVANSNLDKIIGESR